LAATRRQAEDVLPAQFAKPGFRYGFGWRQDHRPRASPSSANDLGIHWCGPRAALGGFPVPRSPIMVNNIHGDVRRCPPVSTFLKIISRLRPRQVIMPRKLLANPDTGSLPRRSRKPL